MIGYVVFTLIGVQFLVADVIQRLVVGPVLWLRPGARERILTAWAQGLRRCFFFLVEKLGRATFDVPVRIPPGPGTLVVMNHQSLLDIPVATRSVPDGYARFVLRARYATGVPLISHMVRLYRHPSVTPGQRNRSELDALRESATGSQQPFFIYPEGHRTRDGRIGSWQTGGLRVILGARRWNVYVVVLDGVTQALSIREFIANVPTLRAQARSEGPFSFDPATEDVDAFIERLHSVMCDKLARMRAQSE